MLKLLNTKTLVSQYGMLVAKTKFVLCGDIISKTHKVCRPLSLSVVEVVIINVTRLNYSAYQKFKTTPNFSSH